MGRDLQKRKRRSGRQPIRQSQRPKKPLNPLGNSIIAKNWDKKETLTQNYRRLGLASRINTPSGGVEKKLHSKTPTTPRDSLAIGGLEKAVVREVKVERDADGKIIRVLGKTTNPLNDLINDIESNSEEEEQDGGEEWSGIEDDEQTMVVRQLEEAASHIPEKRPRYLSQQEKEWLERLVEKHGDDTGAMARDRKLNPMQQTKADIAKRIKKLKGHS